jgi:hypothetical protein
MTEAVFAPVEKLMNGDLILRQDRDTWGRWKYDADTLTLQFIVDGCWHYEIDLETCTDARSILDCILRVSDKTWTTPEDIGDLVRALEHLANFHLHGLIVRRKQIDYKGLLGREKDRWR